MCFLGVVILATSVSDANAATKKAYKHRVVNPPRVVVKNVGGLALSIEGAGFKYMGPQLKRLLKSDSFPLSGKDLEVPSFRPPHVDQDIHRGGAGLSVGICAAGADVDKQG